MSAAKNIITESVCYSAKQKISSISQYKDCLDKFQTNFRNEISLKTKTPIFLDASVLLKYYGISFTEREKLFQFIEKNKDRIILTTQIRFEYLKNREDLIQRFFDEVIPKISKEFNSEMVNKMQSFIDLHKVVLKDYPFVEEGIQKHQKDLKALHDRLIADVEVKKAEYADLIFKDKLLDLLNECNNCDDLIEEEMKVVKNQFDILAKNVKSDSIESIMNKPNGSFPGLADIREKPLNPYGDFIIYHEMMKYMLAEKGDAIFLTYDNSKGDWMHKEGRPHLHYVQNMFANTGHLLYIVDAKRALGEFESLLPTEASTKTAKSTLVKFVDFVSVPWILNHWGGKVCFRQGRNILFKGNDVNNTGTEGCHCNVFGELQLNRVYKIEVKAKSNRKISTAKFSLWCHDDVGEPGNKGVSLETGYAPVGEEGTIFTLYFVPNFNSNIRIHLQYMPGDDEKEEILIEDGVGIYLES